MSFEKSLPRTPEDLCGITVSVDQQDDGCVLLVPHMKYPQRRIDPDESRGEPRITRSLRPAAAIASFVDSRDDLYRDSWPESAEDEYGYQPKLWNTDFGLRLPPDIPKFFIPVIAKAYAHEVAINRRLSWCKAEIQIRMEDEADIESERALDSVSNPHRDHTDIPENKYKSVYFMASDPSTVQYTGTAHGRDHLAKELATLSTETSGADWLSTTQAMEHVAASSLLPWQLYNVRAQDFVHSTMWPTTDEDEKSRQKRAGRKRLIFRLSFLEY